jgi:xylulokinase
MLILGIDIGTSGCKAIVFDERWDLIAHSYREYNLIDVGENSFDLEAETVWEKIKQAVIEINQKTRGKNIQALAVSALGDVIIPLDKNGNTVRPSIIDFDPRGKKESDAFINEHGAEELYRITGMPPIHINSLAKILWIMKNEPENYKKVYRWATFEDYILQKLGVKPTVSYSLAARTMLFNIHNRSWSKEIINAIGVDENSLPEPVPSGRVVSNINKNIAKELGFSRDVIACSGGHDMVCAAIGAGLDVNAPHTALNIMGSMEAIITLMKKPKLNKKMFNSFYPCYPGFQEYFSLSLNLTSGSIVKWYREIFSSFSQTKKNNNSYDTLLQNIDPNNPGDLLLIPHFSGACNPLFNPDAKGILYGLSLNTKLNDIIQSILEGLCFDLKIHIQGFHRAGIPINRLKIVGGGSKSDQWLQLKSNITGMEIISSTLYEASAMGAAALAGTALGVVDNPYKVSKLTKVKEKKFIPSLRSKHIFDEKFLRYQSLSKTIGSFEAQ